MKLRIKYGCLRTGRRIPTPGKTTALLVCSLQDAINGGKEIISRDTLVARFREGIFGVSCHVSFYDHGAWVGDIGGRTPGISLPVWGASRIARMARMAMALYSALDSVGAILVPVSSSACPEGCRSLPPPGGFPHSMLTRLAKDSARAFERDGEHLHTQLYLL